MSFLKHLFENWFGSSGMGGRHGNQYYGGYSKHGNKHGYPSSGYNPNMPPSNPTAFGNVCPKCSASNPAGVRFCQQCGASTGPTVCSNCSQPMAPGAKFCGQCGKGQ